MYVIVEIAGLQYKVEQDQQLFVNRLEGEEGSTVTFDKVLLSDNGSVEVGAPVIDGLAVEAKIIEHLKGDKIIIFKKKRRKGYRVRNGFRPYLTKIEITSLAGKAKKSSAPKKEAKAEKVKEAAPKKEVAAKKETAPQKEAAPEKKVAVKKETAPKKAAAPKKSAKGDDLKKIEGIGPKVMGIFNDAGIVSFADLASKSAEELKEILTPHGGRYAGMTTDTWPKQAQLASEGKWEELEKWQDELDGGKA